SSNVRAVSLVAIGGAGKTTLLERVLASRGEAPGPNGVFVWSFYEDARIDTFLREATSYFRGRAGVGVEPLADALAAGSAHLLAQWGVGGSAAKRKQLASRLGGHALSVTVAGSYAAAFLDGDPTRLDAIDLEDAAEDDPLARRLAGLIEHYARALAPAERDLM